MSKQILNTISKEILTWARKNFDVQVSRIGLLEEVGEAAHCIAKRIQGIRGFDNEEFFKKELTDAIADAGVYTLHNMSDAQMELENELQASRQYDTKNQEEAEEVLGELAELSSDLLLGETMSRENQEIHEAILEKLIELATAYNIDFMAALTMTWNKVKQRDWRKNKEDADKKVGC